MHARTTAQEILNDFPEGLDALITGVGTGGHITGCAEVLKAGLAAAQGVCRRAHGLARDLAVARRAPTPSRASARASSPAVMNTQLLDGVIQVEAEAAREYGRRCAREEGPARGHLQRRHAGRHCQKLPELAAGARVLGFNYDTGERYLSVEGYLPA